jgi:hypothetical protein
MRERAASAQEKMHLLEEVPLRRVLPLAVALAATLAFAAPAHASFHLQVVNEVYPGQGGAQFVEMFDGAGEPFPALEGPYKLVVFDAAGTRLGAQTLDPTKLAGASNSVPARPYLISTAASDAAFPGHPGDETLTVPLPTDAGQACYTAGSGETRYSCIAWGCAAHAKDSVNGSPKGATPPTGQSLQLQGSGSVQSATPTPKQANTAGASAACATPPPAFAGVKLKTHSATVVHSKVKLRIACSRTAQGSCRGSVKLRIGRHSAGGTNFSNLHSGASRVVTIHVTRSLGGHSRRAAVTLDARDSSNRHKVNKDTVTLRPPPRHH